MLRRATALAIATLIASAAAAQEPCTGPVLDPIDGTTLYPCDNAALLGRLPLTDMGVPDNPTVPGPDPYRGNDIWGWHDDANGRSYALVGNQSGTYFVDVTDPATLLPLGSLPTETVANVWRDIKVYQSHAYIVADGVGDHGMQVFDLTRLRGLAPDASRLFAADTVYFGTSLNVIDSAHNLAINEDTGFAYIVGSNDCLGGLHMVDLAEPANPTFAGCYSDSGYTHDAHCVTYAGPDTDYTGREICAAFNEDRVAIVDVTEKMGPLLVSTVMYPNTAYTHQGWFDDDHRYLYGDDELDEINGLVANTRTLRFDLTDLDAPAFSDEYFHSTQATDHNLYIEGDLIFQSNNRSGLRFLQIQSWVPDSPPWGTVGFFDTDPDGDAAGFNGSWSVYPYLPREPGAPHVSLVSDRTRGLLTIAGPFALLVSSEPEAPEPSTISAAPNPFVDRARLTLTVAATQHVLIELYDGLGRQVATVFDGIMSAGTPQVIALDGRDLPPSLYLIRVEGETFSATQRIVRARR